MARTGRPRRFDVGQALDAAMLVFWENGYESTSIPQLQAATGLSSGSMYAAFESKRGLFEAVVDRYMATFGQVTGVAARADLEPRRAIEAALRQSVLMQTDLRHHPGGCLIVSSGRLARQEDQRVRDLLATKRENNRRNLIACAQRGIDRGNLPAGLDAAALGTMFHTFLVGVSTEARDGVGQWTLSTAVGYLMGVWDLLASSDPVDGVRTRAQSELREDDA